MEDSRARHWGRSEKNVAHSPGQSQVNLVAKRHTGCRGRENPALAISVAVILYLSEKKNPIDVSASDIQCEEKNRKILIQPIWHMPGSLDQSQRRAGPGCCRVTCRARVVYGAGGLRHFSRQDFLKFSSPAKMLYKRNDPGSLRIFSFFLFRFDSPYFPYNLFLSKWLPRTLSLLTS